MSKSRNFFLSFLLMSTQPYAFSQDLEAEKVILTMGAPESIECNGKVFNGHAFKLTVTQDILEDDSLDTSKSKIYEDGVFKGICKSELKKNAFKDYSKIFTNLKALSKLTDEEVIKLFGSAYVGYCKHAYNLYIYKNDVGNYTSNQINENFRIRLEAKANELDSRDRKLITAAALKDLVKENKCGTFSKEIVEQTKESNLQKMALADVGFDYLLDQKVTKEEFLKAHYNAVKLQKEFSIKLEEFKANKYSAAELSKAGFSSPELYKAGYALSDLLNNEDVDTLKELASINKFVAAGASINLLKKIGFDEIREIKPLFKIADFKMNYETSSDYLKAPKELKRLEYSAKEIKEVGYGIYYLKAAGFDEIKDIKPLFTIQEFKSEYETSNDYTRAPKELKRLGYSVKEIKEVGYGIYYLKVAGFDEIKDIKPLFTIKDFKSEYETSSDYTKAPKELKRLGYSAKDIKGVGYGIYYLKAAGFDEINEIKPLFTIKEFKNEYESSSDYTKAPKELKRLGYPVKEIKELGYGIYYLKAAGFDEIKDIKPLFSIMDFKNEYETSSDYTKAPRELKRLGYTRAEIKALGFSDDLLNRAGL